jgi:hypothetical protein
VLTVVTTPNAVAAARKHFVCNTLNYVELDSASPSHWSARVLRSELMVSGHTHVRRVCVCDVCHQEPVLAPDPTLSAITLAFLGDTGWYSSDSKVSYDLAYGYFQV